MLIVEWVKNNLRKLFSANQSCRWCGLFAFSQFRYEHVKVCCRSPATLCSVVFHSIWLCIRSNSVVAWHLKIHKLRIQSFICISIAQLNSTMAWHTPLKYANLLMPNSERPDETSVWNAPVFSCHDLCYIGPPHQTHTKFQAFSTNTNSNFPLTFSQLFEFNLRIFPKTEVMLMCFSDANNENKNTHTKKSVAWN